MPEGARWRIGADSLRQLRGEMAGRVRLSDEDKAEVTKPSSPPLTNVVTICTSDEEGVAQSCIHS